jgi:murein DD-endopeptidase MepM/ murein hydrolase activator NlpD
VDDFFDPQRFSYTPDFYVPEIQQMLAEYPGILKDEYVHIGDRTHSFAEVLVRLSTLYSLNPKILLALLEQQSSLISTAQPTEEHIHYALGFADREGLYPQFRQAAIELRLGMRDYALHAADGSLPALVFADGSQQAVQADISLPRYALARVFAQTTTPDQLAAKLDAFLQTYRRLFDDPRMPPTDWPAPAEPFLRLPMEHPFRVTSFFDHNTPLLHEDGDLLSFWGMAEAELPYDGHTGWDYALTQADRVLAAADGTVVFAGNSHDGCKTPARAVIIDHANGYRTLYWHLNTLAVETGQIVEQGTVLGFAGESGCSYGPHLHFQVQYLGRDVDPYGWCADGADAWAENPAGQVSTWLWQDMVSPCSPPPEHAIVVDDQSDGFVTRGNWTQSRPGYAGSALFSATMRGAYDRTPWQFASTAIDTPSLAIWKPDLPSAGRYRVLAYIPYALNGMADTEAAHYRVRHSDGETSVMVDNRELVNGWANLGNYEFAADGSTLVSVSTLAGDEACGVWADAVMWVPVEE